MMKKSGSRYWLPYILVGIILNGLSILGAGLFFYYQPAPKEKAMEVNFVDYGAGGGNAGGGPAIDAPVVAASIKPADNQLVEKIMEKTAQQEPVKLADKIALIKENKVQQNTDQVAVNSQPSNNNANTANKNSGNHNGNTKAKGGGPGGGTDPNKPPGPGNGLEGMSGLSKNPDGSFTAGAGVSVNYRILQDAKPIYPQEAKDVDYNRPVIAQALILVDLNGNVAHVEIENKLPNLGFREAAMKALYKMKFSPITIKGMPVKKYFRRNVHFTP